MYFITYLHLTHNTIHRNAGYLIEVPVLELAYQVPSINALCRVIPTTWRSYCDHRLCGGIAYRVGLKANFTSRATGAVLRATKKVKVAHTRLPSVGFRSWSRFLAVSLQVTWVIIPAVDCHYFPSGLRLPPQPLRELLPILLLGEQRHDGCEQFH